MNTLSRHIRILAIAGATALWATAGTAAVINSCSDLTPDVTNRVTANDGCEAIFLGSGSDNAANISGMFGVALWTQLGKVDPPPGTTLGGELTLTGDTKSGMWSVTQTLLDSYGKIMLLFKSAQDHNSAPSGTVGYLISTLSGDYDSPVFKSKDHTSPRDISHVTLYVAEPTTVVPLPAGGLLLLTALAGLGIGRRRKAS